MPINVLADANIPELLHYLGAGVTVRTFQGRLLGRDDLDAVDALLVRSVTPVGEALLQGSSVKFVGTATSGFEHVDRAWLKQAGIAFAHAPGSNANSVVEYVLAAIAEDDHRLENLFSGGRVGVVGFGHVGRALVRRLEALGIRYVCYDPWLEPASIPNRVEWDELLRSDVVSLHCELTTQAPWPSCHLIGEVELRGMSAQSLLINASRGDVIDSAALQRALLAGSAPRTVLDVWEGEPAISADLLQKVFIGTPHVAGYSLDGKVLATAMLCSAMRATLDISDSAPQPPLPAMSAVCVDTAVEGVSLMRTLLRQSYDILRDDALLREALLGADPAQARLRFDELRRNYRPRRELAGRQVFAGELSAEDRRLVEALGCSLVENAGTT
ncbi:MAG: 4-phosphoerythronate dehydrogenase PdxB [Halioglobus sp.]